MEWIQAQIRTNQESHVSVFQTCSSQVVLHRHDCLELNLVESGSGYYIIEGNKYPFEAGDIFVINHAERHMAVHDEEFLLTVVLFDMDFIWKNVQMQQYLKPFFRRNAHFTNRIQQDGELYPKLKYYFDELRGECDGMQPGWQMVMQASVLMLLAQLYRHYQKKNELDEENDGFQRLYSRISMVFDYIDEHFKEEITLDQLASEIAISRTYLCKYFKDVTKMTIFEYIEQVRIRYSCYLLETTEKSVTEVAMESGFSGVSYFNRVFKKVMETSPSAYRRRRS